MSPSVNSSIGVSILAALIFGAAFMPWGEIRSKSPFPSPLGDAFPIEGIRFGDVQMTLTMTGWNGTVSPFDVDLPNWLVVLAAAGITALCWLRASSAWSVSPIVLLALAAYGLLHAGFALVMLAASDEGSVGVGSLITAIAFSGILVSLVKQMRHPQAATAPSQPPQPSLPA
ncbi:MAG: hypothetical protein AB1486_30485 [Planctomycetota bacterium]